MKKWNINNLLMNDNSTFNYGLTLTLKDGSSVSLYDTQKFKDILLYRYTSFCITNPCFFDTETNTYVDTITSITDAILMFQTIYNTWKSERLPAFLKLYETLRADYNPLWNVDGITGTITEDKHTGTDTYRKSGDDTTNMSGRDTSSSSGSDQNSHTGSITDVTSVTNDTNTKTGNETIAGSGTDTHTTGVTTFDDDHFHNTEQSGTNYGKTDTHTYNNVQDSHTYDDSTTRTFSNTDTLTHGKTDTFNYGKQDKTTYNSSDTNIKNLSDKHIELQIRQGNIGITSSQNLINQQIDLTNRDELVTYIISDFINSYCVL